MSAFGKVGGALLWLAAMAIVAAITHLVSILLMPVVAPRDAYVRLAGVAQPALLTVLPRAGPGETLLPQLDPAVALGVCRYDLTEGPLRLRAAVNPDGFMSFSFHGRDSAIYYAMTDRAATRGDIVVLLLTPAQLEAAEQQDEQGSTPEETRLLAPGPLGYVLVRALAPLQSNYVETENALRSVTCETLRAQ